MIVFACPGQGSQSPGFLEPWLEDPASASLVEELSERSGVDLILHGTVSDAETIRDTAIAQPLIVAASVVSGMALVRAIGRKLDAVAGHSVGEFAAAALTGVLSPGDALSLVALRGRAMADAASLVETGMSAVVGGEQSEVVARLTELGLTAANYNGASQIVAAGTLEALVTLKETPPPGARVIPLAVAGAFHSPYMQPAVNAVHAAAEKIEVSDPTGLLWTNKDGSVVASGRDYLSLLVGQISSPVRWDLCMSSFAEHQVKALIELCPGGAITGLAKRALPDVATVAIKTPTDLATAIDMIEEYS